MKGKGKEKEKGTGGVVRVLFYGTRERGGVAGRVRARTAGYRLAVKVPVRVRGRTGTGTWQGPGENVRVPAGTGPVRVPTQGAPVAHWKMEAGTTVNFVGGTTQREKTKQGGGGRDWVINDDGTIGAKHHPHLVLGL